MYKMFYCILMKYLLLLLLFTNTFIKIFLHKFYIFFIAVTNKRFGQRAEFIDVNSFERGFYTHIKSSAIY